MLQIENIDFEFSTMNKEPKFGYIEEYNEHTMLSKKKRRNYFGKRFAAVFSYAYLTDEQITQLKGIIAKQASQGYVHAQISMPTGTFNGDVNIELNSNQTRFAKINGKWVWTDYQITLQGVDLV